MQLTPWANPYTIFDVVTFFKVANIKNLIIVTRFYSRTNRNRREWDMGAFFEGNICHFWIIQKFLEACVTFYYGNFSGDFKREL